MRYPRIDWYVVVASIVFSVSCGGGGCGGCSSFEPIPGGFPAAKRTPNAAQVRVTSSGFAAISEDPATLLGTITGTSDGILKFPVPAACTGSTPVCCPGGKPKASCGPIDIDLRKVDGDLPRLAFAPAQGSARVDVTVRARIKSETDIPVKLPLIGDCGLKIDTAGGTAKDVAIVAPVSFPPDAQAGTARVAVGTVGLTNLTTDDVTLTGGFFCSATNLILGLLLDVLKDQLTSVVQTTIQGEACKTCPSGQVAECGSAFATACTNHVCMQGATQCFQELGLTGRVEASALFGALSPGTTGALDLYEVAGAATSDNGGLTLGLLGGMQPAGAPRDRCGPPGTPPPATTVPLSAAFQANTLPGSATPYDVAFGLHKSQLAELAYAGYAGGLLCLTIGHGFAAQLSSGTIGLIAPSLGGLVQGDSAMAVGLRPQRPPVITLGKNTFVADGAGGMKLAEPLLDVQLTGAELDFFLSVDDQWIRTFTVVADIDLPIGLQVAAMGQLVPVIGDTSNAFANVSVKNTAAITELPASLAAVFPSLLGLVLPQLSSGLAPIALPVIGGLALDVTQVTSVDNNAFLAIFAKLAPPAAAPAVVATRAEIAAIDEPRRAVLRDPRQWRGAAGPAVTLALGGDQPGLEWSYRLDDGTWSAWSASPRQTVRAQVLWLAGLHHVAVRARKIGEPATIDPSPVVLELPIGISAKAAPVTGAGFHGTAGGAGCACDSGGDPGPAGVLALVILFGLGAPTRWLRRPTRAVRRWLASSGGAVWLAALACLPGCSCSNSSSAPCSGDACVAGDVAHGGLGRFTSVAADASRVMVATYDTQLGDLVVADATDPSAPQLVVVDGIPSDATATHTGSYRNGIEEPGPDVGAWTSIAISGGHARVAYQDRDSAALKYAQESAPGDWHSYVIDASAGEAVGAYAALAIDGSGAPVIAYLAVGHDDGMGHRVTELRIARAHGKDPGEGDWETHVVVSAPGTCAGLCGDGMACIAPAAGSTDPARCAPIDCTLPCAADQTCTGNACVATVPEPTAADDLPSGTGLFASLVVLGDGRLAVAYYDRTQHGLMLSVEDAAGASTFTETTLDATPGGDRGMWASAAVDSAGTVHVAYQDALGDQLMYTTWSSASGAVSTPEVADDGQRAGDRPHNVGAAAALYLIDDVPSIAYQDGLDADVYVATRAGATWSATAIATGPLLDGLSIGATTGHGAPILAWGALDPAATPVGSLVVRAP